MAVEFGLWNTHENGVEQIEFSSMGLESELEDILDREISIASPGWMIVGRQVQTSHGKRIDLLAINGDGNLVVIELKSRCDSGARFLRKSEYNRAATNSEIEIYN